MIETVIIIGRACLIAGIRIGQWSMRPRPAAPRVWEQIEVDLRAAYVARNSAKGWRE